MHPAWARWHLYHSAHSPLDIRYCVRSTKFRYYRAANVYSNASKPVLKFDFRHMLRGQYLSFFSGSFLHNIGCFFLSFFFFLKFYVHIMKKKFSKITHTIVKTDQIFFIPCTSTENNWKFCSITALAGYYANKVNCFCCY